MVRSSSRTEAHYTDPQCYSVCKHCPAPRTTDPTTIVRKSALPFRTVHEPGNITKKADECNLRDSPGDTFNRRIGGRGDRTASQFDVVSLALYGQSLKSRCSCECPRWTCPCTVGTSVSVPANSHGQSADSFVRINNTGRNIFGGSI